MTQTRPKEQAPGHLVGVRRELPFSIGLARIVDTPNLGSKHTDIRIGVEEPRLSLKTLWMSNVVRIHPGNVFTPGHVEPSVQGRDEASVLLVDASDSFVTVGKPVQHLLRAVRRSVVDNNEFEIRERLVEDALNGLF
jgi:hypothetical protein